MPIMDERRELWRAHNSLERTRPLFIARFGKATFFQSEICSLKCEDPFYREYEFQLRSMLYQNKINDDTVIEPWITVEAVQCGEGFGLNEQVEYGSMTGEGVAAYKIIPPLVEMEDIEKLCVPRHEINYDETNRRADRMREAIGDILTVAVTYRPKFYAAAAHISYHLGMFLGMENLMLFLYDRPEWMRELIGRMSQGILKVQTEAENAEDTSLNSGINQSIPYSRELPDPAPNIRGAKRSQLWGFFAAEEFTLISPEMFDEFMLRYQLPIMEPYGLISYGCCEDLTRKIDLLRKVKNLRRIAVNSCADLSRCAEQIGQDYVLSWRPNPAEHVCAHFDPEAVAHDIKSGLKKLGDCHVDITLQNIQTVGGDPDRLVKWARTVRGIVENA
jgi:hypothetical protein